MDNPPSITAESPSIKEEVRIIEVSPRDGLQNITSQIPTSTKLSLIQRLAQSGLKNIELTSIVSPRAVPQLSDCCDVLDSSIVRNLLHPGTDGANNMRLPVLVPNIKGLEIAMQHNVKEIAVFTSASEGFSHANINCSVREGIERAKTVAERALRNGMQVRAYISCIFTDPHTQTLTPLSSVLECTQALLDAGVYEISLGDTTGTGTPSLIRSLLSYLAANSIPINKLAAHIHDSHGRGIENVWTAYTCGVRVFDSSVSGLGGCPFAGPEAQGNVATEDVVELFEGKGVGTGVDLGMVKEVGAWIGGFVRGICNSTRP
ncbi:hypothetical protein BJX99DRAFT_268740 [Aspergillus californicus]